VTAKLKPVNNSGHAVGFENLHTKKNQIKLRDLNDEINKLLREKGHWEDRIKELGGQDYKVSFNNKGS
jgi:hypothetical protein